MHTQQHPYPQHTAAIGKLHQVTVVLRTVTRVCVLVRAQPAAVHPRLWRSSLWLQLTAECGCAD